MNWQVRPLHPGFVGEVAGLDISQPLDAPTVAELTAAVDRLGVLVFHDQPMQDEQQLRFTEYFGRPQGSISLHRADYARRLDRGQFSDISNVDEHGLRLDRTHPKRLYQLSAQLWHSDSSFRHPAGKYTFLCAKQLPPEGGNTEFADMHAAWEALPAARRQALRPLQAVHSLAYSRTLQPGSPPLDAGEARALPPTVKPLVRVHPATGRESLYLSSHAESIVGLPYAEGRALLDELTAFATQPRFVHAHVWRLGDFVMWDNRSTMHRVTPFDEDRHARELRRTTTAEDVPAPALA